MDICLVGSILRHTIIGEAGEYGGWGGMTESAVAPFAALLDANSTIHFVGSVGKDDLEEIREFYRNNYPIVDHGGIFINPAGTDHHVGNKHFVTRKIQVEPTQYKHIEPYIRKADVVIFNFGNIDDINPTAIRKVKENSKALVYVDVHRKPFGADDKGRMYERGWVGWENYLGYADVVQMDRNECGVLFGEKISKMKDVIRAAGRVLDAGARAVMITLGRHGILVGEKAKPCRYTLVPAVPAKVVDTTGAGDAFAAGYLVAWQEGAPLLEAVKLGSLMGSINCEFVGYIKGINRRTINERMPKNFISRALDLKNKEHLEISLA